jgi:aryl-phospho-beta-D-glucosidase BglC (GH1 family)
MQTYVSAMQPGWNLGNTLDAFDPNDPTGGGETSWGNPVVTQAFIQQIAAQGFKSIRIPITWNYRMGGAPNYAIDPAFMDRVQQVVDWSLQAGLYVMINVHHDAWMWISSMPTDHNAVMARYNAVWTQIADRFKNHSDKLMFESINEPEFSNVDITTLLALLNELNTSFVHLVRASGGGNAVRPLVLPTLYCNHEQVRVDSLASTLAALNDPNLIVTVHYYGLWHFSVNIAGYTTFNAEAKNDIDTMVNNVYNTFVSKGIPVVIGELGILGQRNCRIELRHGLHIERQCIDHQSKRALQLRFRLVRRENSIVGPCQLGPRLENPYPLFQYAGTVKSIRQLQRRFGDSDSFQRGCACHDGSGIHERH